MEEFLFPVAIPHTEVSTDKEILFLGRYLSGFFMYPSLFQALYSIFATIA